MDRHEELLDKISEEFFRRKWMEEAKKLIYLNFPPGHSNKERSPDKWYIAGSPQQYTLVHPNNSYLIITFLT